MGDLYDQIKKNEKTKNRAVIINQWIVLIGFVCILFGGCVITGHIIIEKLNKCTSDTTSYLADKFMKEENISYSNARIYFYIEEGDLTPSKIVDVELNLDIDR
jgi:hypothetical protein